MRLLPLILVFILSACGEEKKGSDYDPAKTERYVKYNNAKFETAWLKNARNAKKFFTPGACIIHPPVQVCDTTAIIDHMNDLAESGFVKQELLMLSLEGNNDSLVEQGRYVLRNKEGQMAEKGSYTTTWKRHQGYFKYHRVEMKKDSL